MRLVRFGGAMSLDGYIAGTNGEYDWIVQDPDGAVRHVPDRAEDIRRLGPRKAGEADEGN